MVKRFYEAAAVVAAADGFTVVLDGRPARTPGGVSLILSSQALAQAVAKEWAAQGDIIDPGSMPLTGLANAVLDYAGSGRSVMIDGVLAYAATDLVCYRAEEPTELVERQARAWQPLLDWADDTHGAGLLVTRGIVPVTQPAAAQAALRRAVEELDDIHLVAVSAAAGTTESLVIALALVAGRIDSEEAWEAAQLDESFQRERWGEDAEDSLRRERIKADIEAVERFTVLGRD
ncbi:MAG: ATP12 family protein [Rhodospirillales bacterium]|jgi:chaperone required for assembly of F1-ATPase|nr:ATP12 family protein [Rhodospirillales bacterium]MDP7652308.1 ATP12 family protein [Rhodospirillales bacterium]HJO97764.1 ATP12 family protein [Rhodospirillales bacterium]